MREIEHTSEPTTNLLSRSGEQRERDSQRLAQELIDRGYEPDEAVREARAARNVPGWEQNEDRDLGLTA